MRAVNQALSFLGEPVCALRETWKIDHIDVCLSKCAIIRNEAEIRVNTQLFMYPVYMYVHRLLINSLFRELVFCQCPLH